MFESVEVGNKIAKNEYKERVPGIRTALLAAQERLAESDFSCVILINGVEGAGKSEVVNLLMKWMDARHIETRSMWNPTSEDLDHPPMWRYWRFLPPSKRTTVFFGSWYTMPIIDRAFDRLDETAFEHRMNRIIDFERMLTKEHTIVIKFWFHLSVEEQQKRHRAWERDPKLRWKVSKQDKKFLKRIDALRDVCESALYRTNTAEAPWHLVEATDARYRDVTVGRTLISELERKLNEAKDVPDSPPKPSVLKPAEPNIIRNLNLNRSLSRKKYQRRLAKYQSRLGFLTRHLYEKKSHALTLVFEGPDAAGKGGAIRRVTGAMDARDYQVISTAAPTDEEKARPYLWRFWRRVPPLGRVTIYDRSWYGRVLVERVEGFCSEDAWSRAYEEINDFEDQLTDFGHIVLKFWLAISPEEQLKRFQSRKTTAFKKYKLTEEDWRNREKWDSYEAAACDMIEKTSTPHTPWILVEANNKPWARVKVLKTITEHMEKVLG